MTILAAIDGYHWALDLEIWSGVIFVLLLSILSIFVFPGLGKAMKQRERNTADAVKQAEIALAEIERLRAEHKQQMRDVAARAAELLAEAKRDAERTRGEILEKAKAEADRLERRVEREINLATQKAMHELWETSTQLSIHVSHKILEQQLTAKDHQRLVGESLDEIRRTAQGVSA